MINLRDSLQMLARQILMCWKRTWAPIWVRGLHGWLIFSLGVLAPLSAGVIPQAANAQDLTGTPPISLSGEPTATDTLTAITTATVTAVATEIPLSEPLPTATANPIDSDTSPAETSPGTVIYLPLILAGGNEVTELPIPEVEIPIQPAAVEAICDAIWCYNGTAQYVSGKHQLTTLIPTSQAGSVWNKTQIDLQKPFDKNFVVYLGTQDANGANGIVFVLQRTGTSVLGSSGEYMGYGGITTSVGVEVDTHGGGTNPGDHLGVDENGNVGSVAGPVSAKLDGNNQPVDIEDGVEHWLRVTWDGTDLLKIYFDATLRLTYTKNIVGDIFGGNSLVYYGFTGGTGQGGRSNVQYFYERGIPTRSLWSNSSSLPSKGGPLGVMGDPRDNSVSNCSCGTQGYGGDPINTSTGGFDFSTVDVSLPTVAGPLVFQRMYSSLVTDTYTTTLGYGWTHNQDTHLIFEPNLVWFKAHSANQFRFDVVTATNGITQYVPYAGMLAALTYYTPTYTLTTTDQTIYTFNTLGQLTQWTDAQSHTFTYQYDGLSRVMTITEPVSQRYLGLTYTGSQLTSVRDHTGRHVDYGYSLTTGDLLTVTDILGQNWTYVYAGATHRLTDVRNPRSIALVHTDYDTAGRAWRQYDGLAITPTVQITYTGQAAILTDAQGVTTTHAYNGLGVLAFDVAPLGAVLTKTYDLNFRPATVLDPLSHPTTMTWSATGANLTQVVDALSQTTKLGYDALNNLTQTVDARGLTTTIAYSGTLLTVITDTLNNRTLYTYTNATTDPGVPPNLLKATSDPTGATTKYQYNALGQMARLTDTMGLVTLYAYDALGRVISTTTSFGTALSQTTLSFYNAAGWVTQTTGNAWPGQAQNYLNRYNQVTRYGYDVVGHQIAITDTLGRVSQSVYDNANRLIQTTRNYTTTVGVNPTQYNLTTRYGYNTLNLQVLVTDTVGRVNRTEYDALNRPVTMTVNYTTTAGLDPAQYNLQSVTQYDVAGNVISTTQFFGTAQARTTFTEYDVLNRPVTVTTNYIPGATGADKNIKSVTIYDANGNVTGTVQYAGTALARLNVTQYDALNRPVTVTANVSTTTRPDLNLQSVTGYDKSGNVVTNTQFANTGAPRLTRTQYDSANRPVTVTVNYSTSTSTAGLDYNLQMVTVYSATTGVREASAERRVTSVNGALVTTWITTTYGYDNLGRLITTTMPLTNGVLATTVITYDAAGRMMEQRDPVGRVTHTDYDALDRPITVTVNYVLSGPSDSQTNLKTGYVYDALGNRLTVTDPKGTVMKYDYDAVNRLVGVWENYQPPYSPTADLNVHTVYTYDVASNLLNLQNGRGYVTTHTYDLLNRLVQTQDPLNYTTVYTYDVASNPIAMQDAKGQVITTTYDFLSRPTKIDYPDMDVDFAYDVFGQRTTMTDTTGVTTWAYDKLSRPLTITQPTVGAVSYSYDSASNRSTLKYPDGKVVTHTYDFAGRLLTVKDWATRVTTYTYDSASRLTTLALPTGITSTYAYNGVDRLALLTHATLTDTLAAYAYSYDNAGNRTAVTETLRTSSPTDLIFANGLEGGNISAWTDYKTLSGGSVAVAPDAALVGSLGFQASVSGSGSAAYLKDDRPSAETRYRARFVFDPNSILMDSTDSHYIVYGYSGSSTVVLRLAVNFDQFSEAYTLQAGLLNDSSTWTSTGTFAISDAPHTVEMDWKASSSAGANNGSLTFWIDGVQQASLTGIDNDTRRIDRVEWGIVDGVDANTSGMEYFDGFESRRTNYMGPVNDVTNLAYTYDPLYRLTHANYSTGQTFTYTYDAVGNRLSQTALGLTTVYTYDSANRLTNVGGVPYTWDNNGNLLDDGAGTTYQYDSANRLIYASVPDDQGDTPGDPTTIEYDYLYNGVGDRVWAKKTTCAGPCVEFETRYTLDLNAGLTQVLSNTTGTTTNSYVYGNGRIAQYAGATPSYFLGDALGSVRQLTNSSGAVTLAKSYQPYGSVMSSSGSGASNYGYTGEWTDSTGLQYLRARYYASTQGRFVQKDSWTGSYNSPQSLNGWGYTEGNPINRIDPSGKWYCQSGFVPFGDNCSDWVQTALAQLANSGTTGKKLSDFFYDRDHALTVLGIGGGLICPGLATFATGIKIYFESFTTNSINANAYAIWPDQIHINSSLLGYMPGSPPSATALVTFGHEISHLAQGLRSFSVQAEALSTIVGYYLERDLNEGHRDDAMFIFDNHLDPWSETDLRKYNDRVKLPWSLMLGGGLPRDWLDKWGIVLPYPISAPFQSSPLPPLHKPQLVPTPPQPQTTPTPPRSR